MALPRLLAGRRRGLLVRLTANGLAQGAGTAATALLVERAFDRLVGGHPAHGTTVAFGVALLAATGLLAWLRMAERVAAERLGQDYVHAVRMAMYRRLEGAAPRGLARRSQGAVMVRFVGDLSAIRQWVSLGLSRLVVGGAFALGALAALVALDPLLALAVGGVVAAGLAAGLRLGRPLRETARQARRRRARLAANVNEKVAQVAVVQAFGQTDRERRRLSRQSRALTDAMVERARVAGRLRGVTEWTAGSATAAALVVGAGEVSAGRASAGSVVAAMAIVGLLVGPLRELARVQEYWHASRVAVENVGSFLSLPLLVRERAGAPPLRPGPGRLELDGIRVEGVLREVHAVAEPGSVVAIAGPNGAGKSTLLSVVARLLDADEGSVRLDGQDLAACTLASVRDAVAIAGADLPLLRGSVRRNLLYRRPDAAEEELERIRELCDLDRLLEELPDGLDTRIAEGGRGLSAGQRQRLALARALLGGPRLLLLDEIEAGIDRHGVDVVERVIADQRERGTVLLVTHRPRLLTLADAVWQLADGRLVAGRPRATGARRFSRRLRERATAPA